MTLTGPPKGALSRGALRVVSTACAPALAALAAVALAAAPASAGGSPTRAVHPVFSAVPGVPNGDEAHRRFSAAVARYRLGAVEVADVAEPAPPKAAELLKSSKAPLERLKFDEAQAALDAAVAEARATGAGGLGPAELADLHLHQAIAIQRADWKEPAAPLTEITPPAARAAYLQAATLAPERTLEKNRFPPVAIASWKLAVEEIKARPRGTLLVRAATSALISVDGRAPKAGLATVSNLVYGDHFIRVEDPGRQPWVAIVPLSELTMTVDAPVTVALTLPDARAAEAARRQDAAFALVAELTPGPAARYELRLIDAATSARRDGASVPFAGDAGLLDAAIQRLETEARSAVFGTRKTTLSLPAGGGEPPREVGVATIAQPLREDRPRLSEDPAGWARAHWPLVTAVGVTVGAAVALSFAATR